VIVLLRFEGQPSSGPQASTLSYPRKRVPSAFFLGVCHRSYSSARAGCPRSRAWQQL